MGLNLIIAPTVKPLLPTEVGDHVRADLTAESMLVDLYISAVTAKAENYLKRALITQTWELSLDLFPPSYLTGVSSLTCPIGTYSPRFGAIPLPLSPVQSITSIKYIDGNGTTQTLDPASYYLSKDDPNVVMPAYGLNWPATRVQPGAVTIRYVCGYGDASTDIPEAIRVWILLNVANLYENRESIVVGPRAQTVELNTMADSLLDSFCMVRF